MDHRQHYLGLIGGIGGHYRYSDSKNSVTESHVIIVHGGLVPWILEHFGNTPAMTLGDVVLYNDLDTWNNVKDHEYGHVQQYHIWGSTFLPFYLYGALWGEAWGSSHQNNPFEWDADRQKGLARPIWENYWSKQ